MRKEVIGDATLYLGDCMDILRTLPKVDVIVTDPPYGIALNTNNSRFTCVQGHAAANGKHGAGTAAGEPIAGDAGPFDPSFLLGHADHHIIWGWNHFPDKLPRGACLVWIKRLDHAFGSFLSDAETAYLSKGHGVYCKRDLSNNAIANERTHPTQKPLPLMAWCLEFFPKAQTVMDPFMGSGTTGVAAIQRGLKFTGIEREHKYFAAACRRIEQAYRQRPLFSTEPAQSPEQLGIEA